LEKLKHIKKILIIMMGGIGDMVHFTPSLLNLHRCLPEAKISFLVYKSKAEELIKKAPFIEKIFRIGIDVKTYNIIPRLRKENYEMAIISSGTNPLKSGILCYFIGADYRVGEKNILCNISINKNENEHYLEKNLKLLEAIGCKAENKQMKIWLDEKDWEYKDNIINEYDLKGKLIVIGVHPGSGKRLAFKRWPLDRFASLIKLLREKYEATFILFGGKEESELAQKLINQLNFEPINLAGKTSVPQAAAAISICNLFISNDTGLMHLATIFKIPVIAVYGPTKHLLHSPYGDNNIIIRHELPCSPCYEKKPIICEHLSCLKNITVNEVMAAAEKQIKRIKMKTI